MNLSTREKLALEIFKTLIHTGHYDSSDYSGSQHDPLNKQIERAFDLADKFKEISLKTLKKVNDKIDFKNTNIT